MAGLVVPLGCGGGGTEQTGQPLVPTVAACAKVGASVSRPEGLPTDFPLPPGTVITSSATPYPGQALIVGVVPAELGDAASFFGTALPEAGYEVGRGDAEQGESEAPFTGNGVRGKWKVNGIEDCPSAVTLTLVVIEQ
jgi:hypothetical protein